jgi:hypothetical protein
MPQVFKNLFKLEVNTNTKYNEGNRKLYFTDLEKTIEYATHYVNNMTFRKERPQVVEVNRIPEEYWDDGYCAQITTSIPQIEVDISMTTIIIDPEI